MLSNWLPFLIYALFAADIPATMIALSFVLPAKPRTRTRAADDPVRVRCLRGIADPGAALHGQLLPDGDALHPLRHRDRVPLPARRAARTRSAGSGWWSSSASSSSSASATSTSGARGRSSGTEAQAPRDQRPAARPGRPQLRAGAHRRARARVCSSRRSSTIEDALLLTSIDKAVNVGADEVDVAGHVRARLLRDRDDVDRLVALRHRPLRDGALQLLATPGRPPDRLGARDPQDGRAAPPGLRPDARAQVGDRDGRLRVAPAGCSTTTRCSRASTRSSRSTSTCPAARRGRRP